MHYSLDVGELVDHYCLLRSRKESKGDKARQWRRVAIPRFWESYETIRSLLGGVDGLVVLIRQSLDPVSASEFAVF